MSLPLLTDLPFQGAVRALWRKVSFRSITLAAITTWPVFGWTFPFRLLAGRACFGHLLRHFSASFAKFSYRHAASIHTAAKSLFADGPNQDPKSGWTRSERYAVIYTVVITRIMSSFEWACLRISAATSKIPVTVTDYARSHSG